jgi:hypothetical protein
MWRIYGAILVLPIVVKINFVLSIGNKARESDDNVQIAKFVISFNNNRIFSIRSRKSVSRGRRYRSRHF